MTQCLQKSYLKLASVNLKFPDIIIINGLKQVFHLTLSSASRVNFIENEKVEQKILVSEKHSRFGLLGLSSTLLSST